MPRVKLEDGRTVSLPDGMTQKEMEDALAAVPQAAPKQAGPLMSSPKGFYGPGLAANLESKLTGKTPEEAYKQRVPQLETAANILAPLVLPGGKAASMVGKMGQAALQGGAISGGIAALGGHGAGDIAGQAALGAGAQAVGVPIGAAVSHLFSAIPARIFAKGTAKDIADWLSKNVPSWASYAKNEKGLYEMAHGTGQRTLSDMYEKALVGAKAKLPPDTFAEVPQEVAKKLGIKDWKEAASPLNPNIIGVRASELLDKLPGLKADQGLRRTVLNSLDSVMPDGVIPEARQAYKTGIGWIDFAQKGKFLSKETYDPVKAMDALTTVGKKSLLNRDMDPVRALVRGPMEDPMAVRQISPWAMRAAGLGVMGGGLAGHNAGLGALGLGMEFMPGPRFYSNVPPTALSPYIDALRKAGIQGMTSLTAPEPVEQTPPGSMTPAE